MNYHYLFSKYLNNSKQIEKNIYKKVTQSEHLCKVCAIYPTKKEKYGAANHVQLIPCIRNANSLTFTIFERVQNTLRLLFDGIKSFLKLKEK